MSALAKTFSSLLILAATGMALCASAPWPGTLGLALLCLLTLADGPGGKLGPVMPWLQIIAVACSFAIPAGFLKTREVDYHSMPDYWNHFCGLLSWWVAMAVFAGARFVWAERNRRWALPAMAAAFAGSAIWVALSYVQNLGCAFYCAFATILALLVLWELWCRPPAWLRQTLHTVILLGILLPIANLLFEPHTTASNHVPANLESAVVWTYSAAKRDPAGYEHWWAVRSTELSELVRQLVSVDPATGNPTGLRPGSTATLGQRKVAINHLGFRGPEIPNVKDGAYRIVALGESTTFGFTTIGAGEKPWPELLEQLIRDQLNPARPVQVINAGVPSISLPENLRRFPEQILPLKPDLLISYHGINGFHLLDRAVPFTRGKPPPNFYERPWRLLAEAEYRFRLLLYRRSLAAELPAHSLEKLNLLETDYGRSYRQLVELARTNGIKLVLANFSMVANDRSSPEVLEFYRRLSPALPADIAANAAHTLLVKQLGRQYPDVRIVDTQPGLDGDPEKFLDNVHFSPAGERQLAENIFTGIRDILEKDLRPPP